MSQICYNIIEALSKQDNHIRGLAKLLKINQMNILRNLEQLENQNIVDFRIEGRNKTYFIKKTLEAREYMHILEHDKLLRTIQKYSRLRNIIEQIKNDSEIKLAILFGSYAKNNPDKESDIDIYIETNDMKLKKRIEMIDSRLSIKIGKFDKESLLAKEIIKNHVILKGVERYHELVH